MRPVWRRAPALAAIGAASLLGTGCAHAGTAAHVRALRFSHQPYLGVACHGGGVSCGRIGIAVWLRTRAISVSARLLGRTVRLTSNRRGSGEYGYRLFWTGFVHVGPSRIRTLEPYELHVEGHRAHETFRAVRRVVLSAGWG